MATLAFEIKELKKVIKKVEDIGDNTIIFNNTGSVFTNDSNGKKREGKYLCDLPYNLLDDPNEEAYWPEVKYKFVISKKYFKSKYK